MTGTMTWAAMDVHARSTYAASLDVMTGELSRQRFDTGAIEPVVGWLAGLPAPVRACYEAGPTGFGLYRAAVAAGVDCQVIAPSKTPRPSGDRHKSDRRDTDLLLRQLTVGNFRALPRTRLLVGGDRRCGAHRPIITPAGVRRKAEEGKRRASDELRRVLARNWLAPIVAAGCRG